MGLTASVWGSMPLFICDVDSCIILWIRTDFCNLHTTTPALKKNLFFPLKCIRFCYIWALCWCWQKEATKWGPTNGDRQFGTLCVATGRWLWMIWWQNTKLVRQHSSEILAFYLCLMTTIQPAVPICEKAALTLEEAAAFSNIGINKLREITNERNCDFVFFVGNKRLIKRKRFEQYLDRVFSL